MAVIHIDRNTPVSKLTKITGDSGLRLKWRADSGLPGRTSRLPDKAPLREQGPAANDDWDLPPAA